MNNGASTRGEVKGGGEKRQSRKGGKGKIPRNKKIYKDCNKTRDMEPLVFIHPRTNIFFLFEFGMRQSESEKRRRDYLEEDEN